MNALRRKELRKAIELIEQAKSIVEQMQAEEQDCFDNLPEGIQNSERGEAIEECAYKLDEVLEGLEEQVDELETIIA